MYKNDCLKILTFKSGKFVFSARHDAASIALRLCELDVLHRAMAALPVLPDLIARLPKNLIRQSIHGTAAIEGNPLDETEVGRILDEGVSFVPANDRQREIANLRNAYERFLGPAKFDGPLLLTEQLIKDMHAVITEGLTAQQNIPGQYRNIKVAVGDDQHGGAFVPPKILEDIKTLMGALVEWLNSDAIMEHPPLIRAALAHYHLAAIHPFSDGNGRTARLLEAVMLAHSGWKHVGMMLSNNYHKAIDEYYIAFRRCQSSKDHDVMPFIDMFLRGVKDMLEKMFDLISLQIRILASREHIGSLRRSREISQRQHDFALLLFNHPSRFTLRDLHGHSLFQPLYRKVSSQTARRDVKRLLEHRVLRKIGDQYLLDLDALGL